ncbi:DNA repair protein RecN [Alkaliphilus sp. MSJ-5]|uniref:DNA repair protein RecN n=1 Tax=Alkaliphilus flagellatus TaxID=2841507 RepID=A0ABS6G4Y9_9FIRM|nr:DNA repair protein RecN [Alkaliphilus flagellatus]MBU5677555.1 DNA repair protein RecN [Alkaliphilus flagellatus]
MLLELEVRNFALIDELNIAFHKGLNILTGETGAGKSIIIDAVNMAIGERADRNLIRSGSDKCMVQAIFSANDLNGFDDILEQYGIEIDSENILVVTREIHSNGRSTCRINGIIVTQAVLKMITQRLIDIHGQHEHQSLLNSSFHIDMLDSYGGKEILSLVDSVSKKYSELQVLERELSSICFDEMERERKIDLMKFQIEEIESANLITDEEEELGKQRNILSNSEKIYRTLSNAYETICGENLDTSVLDKLSNIVHSMYGIVSLDENFLDFNNILEEAKYKLEDVARDIRDYKDQIDFEPKVLEHIEMRLDLINSLKRKYGSSIQEMLQYKARLEADLWEFENNEEEIGRIKKEIDSKSKELRNLSIELSLLRRTIAADFEKKITGILLTLNMGKVQFKVSFDNKENDYSSIKFTSKGIDQIEFTISTNLGEPLKPLSKIASGGEMSRIMLAFKTILADVDNIPTLIFDEIDTGISGRTAQIIGERLYDISNHHQIICITHLPQIASMANHHYLIEKIEKENNMKTIVKKLNREKRIKELGRLLGGELTDITIKHAEEIIDQAHLRKSN